MIESGLVPLGFLLPGQSGTVVDVRGLRHHVHEGDRAIHAGPRMPYRAAHRYHGDRGHRLEHRLQQMGLSAGQTVTVVRNTMSGPVIVAVKDTRLGIARGIASRIYVRPAGGGSDRGGTGAGGS